MWGGVRVSLGTTLGPFNRLFKVLSSQAGLDVGVQLFPQHRSGKLSRHVVDVSRMNVVREHVIEGRLHVPLPAGEVPPKFA